MAFNVNSRAAYTRRNGERITGKVVGFEPGKTGDWALLQHKVGKDVLTVKCRPSQLERPYAR